MLILVSLKLLVTSWDVEVSICKCTRKKFENREIKVEDRQKVVYESLS